ncbi:MAG: winged helix-turn-helix transcriptional regulator [Bacilli bacterium]|nr:winged helix-turn-helix transcriptional regulator [Bacilli bacterium]
MERMVGIAVKKIDNMISREVIKETKENELLLSPIQVRIIKLIKKNSRNGKEVFQRDIENKFEIRRSTTSGILNTMEKNGLIKRENSSIDKRQNKIIITEYGEEIFLKIKRNMSKLEKRIIKNISEDELNTFFNVIDKMKDNLEGD